MQVQPVLATSTQFEFKKFKGDFNFYANWDFRIELALNPQLRRRRIYTGLVDWGTHARMNGSTSTTYDRANLVDGVFEWFYKDVLVGSEEFKWSFEFFTLTGLIGSPLYTERPLMSASKEGATMTGEIGTIGPDSWIASIQMLDAGNSHPVRVVMPPSYRNLVVDKVVWRGHGFDAGDGVALANKTTFFLGVYGENP